MSSSLTLDQVSEEFRSFHGHYPETHQQLLAFCQKNSYPFNYMAVKNFLGKKKWDDIDDNKNEDNIKINNDNNYRRRSVPKPPRRSEIKTKKRTSSTEIIASSLSAQSKSNLSMQLDRQFASRLSQKGANNNNSNNNNNNMNNINNMDSVNASIISSDLEIPNDIPELPNNMQFSDLSKSPRNKNIYKFKIVLVGDANVGKSCIIRRYVMNQFDDTNEVTIGMDISTKILKIDDMIVQLNIWDTASDERFSCLTRNFFTNVDCILLVYDITNMESLNNIENRWVNEMVENATNDPFVMLVGNKVDSHANSQTSIDSQKAQNLAKKHGWQFCQVSAKSGHCVSSLFMTCAIAILLHSKKQRMSKSYIDKEKNTIELNNYGRKGKRGHHKMSSCCQSSHF